MCASENDLFVAPNLYLANNIYPLVNSAKCLQGRVTIVSFYELISELSRS